MTGRDLRLGRGAAWDRWLRAGGLVSGGCSVAGGGRRWRWRRRGVLPRNRCGSRCSVRVIRDLPGRRRRRDADHRLAQPARGRGRPRLRLLRPRLCRRVSVRLRRGPLGRARQRLVRRRHANHGAAKALLRRGRREADYGVIKADQAFATTHTPRRFRGVLRSAMGAQPHRAHYTPGLALATTRLGAVSGLQGLCPIEARSPMGERLESHVRPTHHRSPGRSRRFSP